MTPTFQVERVVIMKYNGQVDFIACWKMVNTTEKEEQGQTGQEHVGKGIAAIPSQVAVFKGKFEGSGEIIQKAIWEKCVFNVRFKGPTFGAISDDFQDQLKLMWLERSKLGRIQNKVKS